MIIDLAGFIRRRQPDWETFERMVRRMEDNPALTLSLDEARHYQVLLERVAGDLLQIDTAAVDPATQRYLESLLARGYGQTRERRGWPVLRSLRTWFGQTFPQTVRRRAGAMKLTLACFFAGVLFGVFALWLDPSAKAVLLPFDHLQGSPSERVAAEEADEGHRMDEGKGRFSAFLMTHNTRVSIFTFALGMTGGIGVVVMLFYNGVILGAVGMDYLLAGEGKFLAGWLLPHGSVEIPAILLAGQAGFVLGAALLLRDGRKDVMARLTEVRADLLTLVGGAAALLVWAGIIEGFFSQYHEPVVPYTVKIFFGTAQLLALIAFFALAGRGSAKTPVAVS